MDKKNQLNLDSNLKKEVKPEKFQEKELLSCSEQLTIANTIVNCW